MLHSCGATRLGACTPARRRTIIRPPLITEGTPSPLLSRRASVRFALESPFVPVHAPRFHHSAALFAMGCGEYFSFSQVWLYHSRALKSCQSLFLPFSAKYIQNTIPANRIFTLTSIVSLGHSGYKNDYFDGDRDGRTLALLGFFLYNAGKKRG